MTPRALRRYLERWAVASLPALAPLGCGTQTPSAAPDMAVALGHDDLGCPMLDNGCMWLTYVDFGTPGDNLSYWSPDAGADTCAPCNFGSLPNVYCGQCEVVQHGCGVAYFCSTLNCSDACGASGRRPPGLWLATSPAARGVGEALARMAHLEAASVPAFAQLAAELHAHGAPERLVAGARRALVDEERHARIVGDLARRHGARPPRLDVEPTPLRPLFDIALDNGVEGCVRETMGAALAAAQARTLADATLAAPLRAIAVDERRHADLAWALDAWLRPRLSPAERRAVDRARAAAARELLAPAVA